MWTLLFLPYLWGIETLWCSMSLWRGGCVFTLPMRHWNIARTLNIPSDRVCFYPTYEALKLYGDWKDISFLIRFLPYLWGIETIHRRAPKQNPWNRFYPTYEALKPLAFVDDIQDIDRFYPTYEALKHDIFSIKRLKPYSSLPYLWGIETNNNPPQLPTKEPSLPYLWGIETFHSTPKTDWTAASLPYLWGIETKL